MASSSFPVGRKRKATGPVSGTNSVAKKRQKYQEARVIAAQTADRALSRDGELNINHFIQAREFEIGALDKSMQKARQSLMSRAFQSIPRHMRRRTASHNAKKVPRRLRRRAEREMRDDNTPTVTNRTRTPSSRLRLRLQNARALKQLNVMRQTKRQRKKAARSNAGQSDPSKHVSLIRVPRLKKNTLADPPMATTKFKRRQLGKTWLPTHLWHAKRARMTRSTEPLWRMAIPLRPTEKSYRSTHRAANSRGALAWDVSYMCTIGCQGTEHALENLLKAFAFKGAGWNGTLYRRWKSGTRFAASWVLRKDHGEAIAPILALWAPSVSVGDLPNTPSDVVEPAVDGLKAHVTGNNGRKMRLDRRILIRIHPSAFHEFWTALIACAKIQKPQVLVEDLRFEIGSIDITGPGSAEALNAVLRPQDNQTAVATLWNSLASVSNPAHLPLNAVLAMDIGDPRWNHPPKQVNVSQAPEADANLLECLTNWPIDAYKIVPSLFSHKLRYRASKLLTQKAINRRKGQLTPNQHSAISSSNPTIPILIFAQRAEDQRTNSQGTWTVLAPYKCIDPIWRSLMYYPLSSGDHPRFGGLQQTQQVLYERSVPWFPGDMPGTEAGKAWGRTQATENLDRWIRKPSSRRLAFHSVDLGLGRRGEVGKGWACDWDYLLRQTIDQEDAPKPSAETGLITQVPPTQKIPLTQRQRKAAQSKAAAQQAMSRERNTSSPESDVGIHEVQKPAEYSQMPGYVAALLLAGSQVATLPAKPALVSVKIMLQTKGTPNATARIYRLPKTTQVSGSCSTQLGSTPKEDTNQPNTTPDNSTPPAAQRSPAALSSVTTPRSKNHSAFHSDLRSRWLELYHSSAEPPAPNGTPAHIPKLRTNHHSLPRKHQIHPIPDLRNVIVLPPDAPQEVVDQHGPKPLTEAEVKERGEAALRVRLDEESIWNSHIPCPDEEDLIGFVTSGGYNLYEGRGTAIGSIWVQRVVERWAEEDKSSEHTDGPSVDKDISLHGRGSLTTKKKRLQQHRQDKERHICIIRNAGESVGRIGIWELCQ